MENIQVLLGYCPVYGKDLSHELIKIDNVKLCYNAAEYYCYTEEEAKIINFNQRLGRETLYEKVYDLNKLPALDKDLMEQMRPYESMIYKLASRKNGFPIVDYEKEKRNFHKHLRFWNYIFEKYSINMLFFEEIPHVSYTYLIYCLGVVKGIPTLLCDQTSIQGIRVYGNSIENMGANIQDYYETVCKKLDVNECCLSGTVEEFYNRYSRPVSEIKADRKKNKFEKKEFKKSRKYNYGRFLGRNAFLKPLRYRLSLLKKVVIRKKGWGWYKEHEDEIRCLIKDCYDIRFFKKHTAMWQKSYNAMAVKPDYNQKYIYFGLQLTPEATTMPRAGVFAEQYTSVQLLARAAEKENVLVYVKEHYVQTFRDREVYKLLSEIPNVKLIKTTESSFDLMSHSIAVATQTGTCILEGALLNKPALVFGEGYLWKGMPNVFEITDEEQGVKIVHRILSGFSISADEIKKYFYAIQKQSIECYLQEEYWNQSDREEHKDSVKRFMKLLEEFLEEVEGNVS